VLTVLGVYLLAGSRERPWADASIMYQVAQSVVSKRALHIDNEWYPMSHRGPDGKIYSLYGLLPSLAGVPGILARNLIHRIAPGAAAMSLALTSHVAVSLAGALSASLFFGMCIRLGASRRAATAGTLALTLSTGVFVYARTPFSEAFQILCFTGLCADLLRIREQPTRRRALALGAWAGALFNTKLVFAASVAGAAIVVVATLWRDRKALARVMAFASATLLPLVAVALGYNAVRWGSPFVTGYESVYANVREWPWIGLLGLFASPGKGLFFFSPPLITALCAWPGFVRAHKRHALALALTALPPLAVYSRYLSWSGDYCWGPRYIAYLLPAAMLPLTLMIDRIRWRAHVGRRTAVAVGAACALGLYVQLLGSAFYWDHYIRISMAAKNAWLGQPNRAGASLPMDGTHCGSCFEDMYAHTWLPHFSPLLGHAWLLRHVTAGSPWQAAARDAPWTRHTSLVLDISATYRAARVDWWGLLWIVDDPSLRAAGVILLVTFALMTAAGAVIWVRKAT